MRWSFAALIVGALCATCVSARAEDLGLRLPPDFRVTTFADETLANDIYAMTLDAKGQVVVTSRGYIKTLHDDNGDGKADRTTLFAPTGTGGMGLCFDGNDLYFCGDGWLSRYRDADGNGQADGPPEKLIPLAFGEHGGHAMRKGPDGWWYVIGGNDAKVGPEHATLPTSPVSGPADAARLHLLPHVPGKEGWPLIKTPEAGGLLRLPPNPDGKQCEVIAQGFRNPYDFDFNAAGDIFTYDSDCERDYLLPWYTPTRIYHVAEGGHHGWRLPSHLRAWARRGDYLDTVDILCPIGRGSPTGVVCYRHHQFPEHYRGGVFALDWTFGKVYFLPLTPEGASYRTTAEVFIEPTGSQGFAPTDAAVAPDGSLYISIGGRGTRGAVYRIEYTGKRTPYDEPRDDLERVLEAPQPLDAWSRAVWVPLALKLGAKPFRTAIVSAPEASRIRAIEILTELFGGLTPAEASLAEKQGSAGVRARVAWSLGRKPSSNDADAVLFTLARDRDPCVRVAALNALANHYETADRDFQNLALPSFDHADKRVRQAAARFASGLSRGDWNVLERALQSRQIEPAAQVTGALAAVWRKPGVPIHKDAIELVRRAFNQEDDGLRLQAVRLITLALGDWHLIDPPVEVHTAYSVQPSLTDEAALVERIRPWIRPLVAAKSPRLREEAVRLLAILEDDDPAVLSQVADAWTMGRDPTLDLHYLIAFSRLKGARNETQTEQTALALLSLDRNLQGQELRSKQAWSDRLTELVTSLTARDPRLPDALLKQPNLATASHVAIASALPAGARPQAAEQYLKTLTRGGDLAWTGPLIDLLALLSPAEIHPIFRAQWENFALRDALVLQLATRPDAVDRDKYLWALESNQPQVVRAGLAALNELPRDAEPTRLVPLLRLLQRAINEPKEREVRRLVVALIERQRGEKTAVREEEATALALRRAYQPIFDAFEHSHPDLARSIAGVDIDLAAWREQLKTVDWSQGDAARGAALFQTRACQTCHTGQRALGPDLTGVTNRFTRDDLFTTIVAPSLDVAPPYRTTLIATKDGQIHSGLIAFESADGVILQTGAATTVRVATDDVAERRPGTRSLMPEGLLKELKPGDLADLYRYLQTLSPRAAAGR